jgi:NADH-quinone oxidoreductase subunit J
MLFCRKHKALLILSVLAPCAVVVPAALGSDGAAAGSREGVTAASAGGFLEVALFYGIAVATVVSSLGVCIEKNIVRMAVWMFIALGSVALLYFMLAANFIAAIQLIVYVGGVLILLIFGVMLTSKSPWVRFQPGKLELISAAVVCCALLVTLCLVLARAVWPVVEGVVPGVAVADLGWRLLTAYLVPFEIAGVLLMIVMVGAAHLARQEKN